jgi:putative flippase GtrA
MRIQEKLVFLAVGGFSASCYLFIAWALHALGLWPTPSSAVSYALCIPLGYLGHRYLTFRSNQPHDRAAPRYIVVQGLALLIVTVTTFVASAVAELPALVSFFLAAVTAASASYLMQRHWVF